MPNTTLSVPRAVALYVGALLGPALLLLPGLAVVIAGPASVLAWSGLIGVSGLLAALFALLAITRTSAAGAAGYVHAAFGPRAGRIVAAWFRIGVIAGAPTVCLIGGSYATELLGGGRLGTDLAAAVLLAAVVFVTSVGLRLGAAVQLGLVGVLVIVVLACVGSGAAHSEAANFTPFAPHGWTAIGSAASVLMLSFVGWEAVAPLTGRLARPRRDVPRVVGVSFGLTSVIYLALAVVTVAALGAGGGGAVPLAALLELGLGDAGRVVAVVAAVVLTLGATNAYISGAIAMTDELRRESARRSRISSTRSMASAVSVAGVLLIGGDALGLVDVSTIVAVPTTLFVAVYLLSAAAGVRLLTGAGRAVAVAATVCVVAVLVPSGRILAVPVAIALVMLVFERLSDRVRHQRVVRDDAEPTGLVVGDRLLELRAGVHDERPVLHDGLADRLPAQDQKLECRTV